MRGVYSTYHRSSDFLATMGFTMSHLPVGSTIPMSTTPTPAPVAVLERLVGWLVCGEGFKKFKVFFCGGFESFCVVIDSFIGKRVGWGWDEGGMRR